MKRALLLAVLGFAVGTLLTGCQDSPWGVFSPKTDLHIRKIEPIRVVLDSNGYALEDGEVVFTAAITNGVSAMIKGADVHYYSKMSNSTPKFTRAIRTQIWIAAPNVVKETGEEASIRAQTATDGEDDAITFQIGDQQLWDAMKEMAQADTVAPQLAARIFIFGTDENSNDFTVETHMPVAFESKDTATTETTGSKR